MPLNILGTAIVEGTDAIPYYNEIRRAVPWVVTGALLKYVSRGRSNIWERKLHGKVYLVTGGTTQSMGSSVVLELARLGAQVVILVRHLDSWVSDWIEDVRNRTGNELVYAEECDLADLYAVRKFATRWLDNQPPRRLDGVIVMSGDREPHSAPRAVSKDGLEMQVAVNYTGVFHVLDLLQPCLRAQPQERDVRIVVTTCGRWGNNQAAINEKDPLWQAGEYNAGQFYRSSHAQLQTSLRELQRRLSERPADYNKKAKENPEEAAEQEEKVIKKNIRVALVDPGTMRSPSLRRVISNGSVIRLIILYCMILYPFLYFFTKSGRRGAQSVLYAIMTPELEAVNIHTDATEPHYVRNCKLDKSVKPKMSAKALYDATRESILQVEKRSALARNKSK